METSPRRAVHFWQFNGSKNHITVPNNIVDTLSVGTGTNLIKQRRWQPVLHGIDEPIQRSSAPDLHDHRLRQRCNVREQRRRQHDFLDESGIINATGGTLTFADIADNSTDVSTLTINARIIGAINFEACCNDGTLVLTNNANTYTGNTLINNGTKISVSNIGNTGSLTSNLGQGTQIIFNNDALNEFTYTGAGETTNRILIFSGNSATQTIRQSGTGAARVFGELDLRRRHEDGRVDRFDGRHRHDGRHRLQCLDRKTGTGTWILSGVNTFTGA